MSDERDKFLKPNSAAGILSNGWTLKQYSL